MTALLVSDIFPPKTGGSGRWFWEIYRRLPRGKFLVAAGEHPEQKQFDSGHDLPVTRLPLTVPSRNVTDWDGLKRYVHAARALRRLVREEQIEVIHCGRCLPEGLMGLALKWWTGTPYICYAHGEDVNVSGKAAEGQRGGIQESRQLRWLTGRVLRQAAFVIANCHNTGRILREDWGLPAEQVRVLYPGVDTNHFTPTGRNPKIRARLGWGDRPVVLTASRLQQRKGQDMLIRALLEVRRTIPAVLYAIVGDGEQRPALEKMVEELGLGGHVRFLGEVDDAELTRCYQQCDLFVLPNRQVGTDIEGFGMVLLEAQACGKPVIAGRSGGTSETMRVGETGLVVPCEGPDELAKAVAELLADAPRRARMGAAARRRVVEHFDWTVLSERAAEWFAPLPVEAERRFDHALAEEVG